MKRNSLLVTGGRTMNADISARREGSGLGHIRIGVAILTLILGSINTVTATHSWTAAVGFWTNAGNWSPASVPSGDDVLINNGGTAIINANVPNTFQFVGINGALNQTAGNYVSSSPGLTEFRVGQGGPFTYS